MDDRLNEMKLSATLLNNDTSNNNKNDLEPVIKLGFGGSPFLPPSFFTDYICKYVQRNEYSEVQGISSLRELISQIYTSKYNYFYSTGNVIIGPGTKQLMFILLKILLPEINILLPTPAWVTYYGQCQLLHKKVVQIKTTKKGNWKLTPELIERSIINNSSNNHLPFQNVLILTNPDNPTGSLYTSQELFELGETIRKTNTIVLLDEIYADVTYIDKKFVSLAEFIPNRCIISSGLSKSLACGGYRLGYFIIPSDITNIMHGMSVVASETHSCIPACLQLAWHDSLKYHQNDIKEYQFKCNKILSALGIYCYNLFKSRNIDCTEPCSSWYLFLDFQYYTQKLNDNGIFTSEDLCKMILKETNVSILQGEPFLPSSDETIFYARICLVDFDGEKAYHGIPEGNIDETWLKKYCRKTIEGVERICDYMELI